jgi:hypothetical protein
MNNKLQWPENVFRMLNKDPNAKGNERVLFGLLNEYRRHGGRCARDAGMFIAYYRIKKLKKDIAVEWGVNPCTVTNAFHEVEFYLQRDENMALIFGTPGGYVVRRSAISSENVHPEYNLVAVWNMCAEKEYDGIDVWFN